MPELRHLYFWYFQDVFFFHLKEAFSSFLVVFPWEINFDNLIKRKENRAPNVVRDLLAGLSPETEHRSSVFLGAFREGLVAHGGWKAHSLIGNKQCLLFQSTKSQLFVLKAPPKDWDLNAMM